MVRIRRRVGFGKAVYVDPVGVGGGLTLLYNDGQIEVLEATCNIMDPKIAVEETRESCRLTLVYADCDFHRRQAIWDRIRCIRRGISKPWLCMGDFNDIVRQGEKDGGGLKEMRCIRNFVRMFCMLGC